MHLNPVLTTHRIRSLRTWLTLLAAPFMVFPVYAQALREDAINKNTKTSPREFRAVQSMPVNERLNTTGLVAQNNQTAPPAAAPVTPPPGGPPAGNGGPPGFGDRGGRRIGGSTEVETMKIEGDKVTLQFPNNTVSDILGIYERLTGKTLIKDTAIFEGQSISLVTPQPVEKAEAIKLIEASLLTNGYAIVADPDGKSSRILTTRTQGNTGAQFSQGVKFYQSANDLPNNETIVSYFMALTHLDPTEAATMLGGHIGLNSYGRITAVTTPPGLLITENANIVRQLVSIKEVIDVANSASSLITKFIPLKYADATTVAQIVQATLDAQAKDNQTKGMTTVRGQSTAVPGAPNNPQQPQAQSGSTVQVSNSKTIKPKASSQVVADSRLNQLLVVAEPDDYAYVVSLIAEFDKPVEVPVPYERKLNNIYSVDVLPVLADLLQEAKSGSTQLPGGGTLNQQQQAQTSSSNSFLTGRSSTTNARGGTFSTSSGSSASTDGTGSGVTSRPDQLIESSQDSAPISVLINKTRIIADPLANSIIVIGPKESQDKVEMLLEKLDQKSPQVYLATVIGQLTLGKGSQIGVDYLQKFSQIGNNSGMASSFIASREDAISNSNISDLRDNLITTAFGPAKGLNIYGQVGDALDVFISALSTTNDFKVLSRPSVFALNNKKAVITSGQSIPVPSQTLTNSSSAANNTGNVTTTIEYKDVVLKLEVIPLINPDGNVTLRIAQVNDTVVGNQLVGGNEVPIIGTEQLTTTVTVPDGNTIVIGGLITEQDKLDSEGIPGLNRIPLLGRLFREDTKSKERRELIIFIQPVVVGGDAAMKRASMDEDMRTKIGSDAYKTFPDKVVPRASAEDPLKPENRKRWYVNLFKNKSDKPAPSQPPILRKQ